jgi:hypothetical protein
MSSRLSYRQTDVDVDADELKGIWKEIVVPLFKVYSCLEGLRKPTENLSIADFQVNI